MLRSQPNRRDFIRARSRRPGGGPAAASVPLDPGPSTAWATPAGAPSETVRFGMIGIGMQGTGLLATAIRLPGVECAGACDLYDGRHVRANEIIQEVTGRSVPTTRRYQDLLDNKEIDCVVVAVPDHWHQQIIVDACNAGKDVYCEKPMTHRVAEGFEIISAADKNNRIVQIGSQRRSSIVYAKARELVGQGAIGDVVLVEGGMGRNDPCGAWVYPPPPDLSPQNLDWETWQGDAPKRPFDPIRFARWRGFQDYGEGIPGDLFVHVLTGIHYVMNVTAPPARALSVGGLFRWKDDGRDQPDEMATLYDYPSFRAVIRVTLNTDLAEVTRFLGTRGMIEIRDDRLTLSPQDGQDHEPCYYTESYPEKMHAAYVRQWHEEHDRPPGTAQAISASSFHAPPGYNDDREHLWNFFQSVRTRQPSVEDARFGNHTAIGCHMANYSYFRRTVAVWDESAREIKG